MFLMFINILEEFLVGYTLRLHIKQVKLVWNYFFIVIAHSICGRYSTILTLFEIPNPPEEPKKTILIAIVAVKRKVFLRISLFNMLQSFNGLASQQALIQSKLVF